MATTMFERRISIRLLFVIFLVGLVYPRQKELDQAEAFSIYSSEIDAVMMQPTTVTWHNVTAMSKQHQSFKFFTLSYDTKASKVLDEKRKTSEDIVLHNCLMAKNQSSSQREYQFVVYTDDMLLPVCQQCDCRQFIRYNCSCPIKNCAGKRNICEKNHFFSHLMAQEKEFVFLDFDLIILDGGLFEEMYSRSRTNDFLATRAHGTFNAAPKYRKGFNSGLVFIRTIPEADPLLLRKYLYSGVTRADYDQRVLSYFVHQHYKRWDELSIKWHCRKLGKAVYSDMPLSDCVAFHPQNEEELERLKSNYTLLTP